MANRRSIDMDHRISPLLTVPNEILYEIASHLPRQSVISLLKTSHAFHLPLRSLLISQNKNEILLFAAQRNHLALLTIALSAGADISYRAIPRYYSTLSNDTALHHAAAGGYTDIIAELLRYNPPLEDRGGSNETPLLCAAWKGHQAAVDLLLAAGCDPKALGRRNSTLLLAAITCGLEPTAIAYIDQMGESALKAAITHKRLRITQLMIARGMAIAPLLPVAAAAGVEYVKLCLEDGARINDVPKMTKCTALSVAVSHGNAEVVAYLLKHGANPDKGPKKNRPIMIAAYRGDPEMTRQLLDHGVDLKGLRNPYADVLVSACVSSPPELVAMLLDAGQELEVNGNSSDERKPGPLHVAAESGNAAVIHLLLERGARVNERRGPKWETPLHWAARAGRVGAVIALLEGGADPQLKCNGNTALLMANRSWEHPDRRRRTMAALVRGGANINALGTKSRAAVAMTLVEEKELKELKGGKAKK